MIRKARYIIAPVFTVVAAVFGVVAVASGSIPGDDGSISGCYVKTTGALRVVDTKASTPPKCRSTEIALAWNQVGLKGETGPAGPAGEQGPAGEPGTSGAQELFFAFQDSPTFLDQNGGNTQIVSKALPAGSYRIAAQMSIHGRAFEGVGVECWLTWDGAKFGARTEYFEPRHVGLDQYDVTDVTGALELVAAGTKEAGKVAVSCRDRRGYVPYLYANLVATRVASVN